MDMARWILTLFAVLDVGSAFAEEAGPRLSLPVMCRLGEACFIQSYVDVDPGPGVRDYACGGATYDGHNGTDFRLQSAAQSADGVAVVAAADGRVKGTRDGMADIFAGEVGKDALRGRECGNGVVVDHGRGWETQYCHLRHGSIAVKTGDAVRRGQRLGEIGYSGLADFSHLHLSLRRRGEIIDPFSGRPQNGDCRPDAGGVHGLWEESAAEALQYAGSRFLSAGFAAAAPDLDDLERNHAQQKPDGASAQLVFFARLLNLRAGDRIRIAVKGPENFEVETSSPPLDRNKASYLVYAGKRRTLPAWPPGRYEAHAQLVRDDKILAEMRDHLVLAE